MNTLVKEVKKKITVEVEFDSKENLYILSSDIPINCELNDAIKDLLEKHKAKNTWISTLHREGE
jgi:hypothetical protein